MHDPTLRDPARPARARLGRRAFLQVGGVSAAGVLLAACGDDEEDQAAQQPTEAQTTGGEGEPVVIDFSQGDAAVVNFAYALEQLEAAFYEQVEGNPPSDFTDDDRNTLADIGAHEISHRELLKAVLGDNAIPALTPDFSMVDFSSRQSVLETAETFETLGVGAYNGAASFLNGKSDLGLAPLVAAGEIVSVEARHASAVRTLLSGPESADFAPGAFSKALSPSAVLQAADPFIKTNIRLENLPKGS